MPFNGSGTFNVYTPGTPYVTGTTISSTVANNVNNDFATGLSTAITRDGQTTATAVVPFALGIKTDTITENTSGAGVTVSKQLNTQYVAVASNTTANIGGAAANYVNITGTTGPITGFGTVATGALRAITFNAATTITYNATTNILPTSANITTQAGDSALMASEGAGIWRMLGFFPRVGLPTAFKVGAATFNSAAATGTVAVTGAGFKPRLVIMIFAFGTTSNAASIGFSDGATDACWTSNNAVTVGEGLTEAALADGVQGVGVSQRFTLATGGSMDADGFTFANTKTGSPAGTMTYRWLAIR